MRIQALLANAAALALATSALAAPIVDGALGDHAVLQRGRPIILTGKALPGETVSANLAGNTVSAQADKAGRFRLTLPALEAGGPYRLLLDAPSGQQVIDDLLIGDVFLCSGQSNMEMTTEQSQNSFQIYGASDPQIRLMTVPKRLAFAPLRLRRIARASCCSSSSSSVIMTGGESDEFEPELELDPEPSPPSLPPPPPPGGPLPFDCFGRRVFLPSRGD